MTKIEREKLIEFIDKDLIAFEIIQNLKSEIETLGDVNWAAYCLDIANMALRTHNELDDVESQK